MDEINVDASLAYPQGEGPFPAVIFVAGSGPTDRNWNTPYISGTNGSGALLARALTENGFVTLRYDKRVSGSNAAENVKRLIGKVSMHGHMAEVAGGVELLINDPRVDPAHLFVLTNSEGCVHALNYQAHPTSRPLAGMVLTSAFARPAGVLARTQVAGQLQAIPGGEPLLKAYDSAVGDFEAGRPVQVDEKMPEMMRQLIMGISAPINQPFSRELWLFNPLEHLVKVNIPVLVVLGKKDFQVDAQVDGALFVRAAKDNDRISVAILANANHVLKLELRPRAELTPADVMASYGSADVGLDPEAVETITSWLKAH